MEIKDYQNSNVLQALFAANKNVDPQKSVIVGNNGYALGQVFHTTGLTLVPAANSIPAYVGITTQEGPTLSLKSVMSISSLNGYYTEGEFINESGTIARKETATVKAEVIEDFAFSEVFQPTTRNFFDFIAKTEKSGFWADRTVTYLGKAVRPYIAKKASPQGSIEKYEKDFKRAMVVKLWSVE